MALTLRHVGKAVGFAPLVLPYFWYHKVRFGITNTKFDISFLVFRESFLQDQYRIKEFLKTLDQVETLFFLDLGRNHGFVFYYTMFHVMKQRLPIKKIEYVGVDPSPLKFVYFNYFGFLASQQISVDYYLIDKAIVFDDIPYVKLKYGEHNFGNFNVSGSNYDRKLSHRQNKFRYVEINVETIQLHALKEILARHMRADAIIVKIDCKNRTDFVFTEFLTMMEERNTPYLISCESDGSSKQDLSRFAHAKTKTLCASNVLA